MGMHYEGWIQPRMASQEQVDDDQRFLEELGVEVGKFDSKKKRFEDCVVPASIHAQLTMQLGRFDMDLEAIQTEESEEE